VWINNSKYAFAVIECFPYRSSDDGAVVMVDARLLRYGFRNQKVSEVAAAARPWLIGSSSSSSRATASFSSLAVGKYYWNIGFWWKMSFSRRRSSSHFRASALCAAGHHDRRDACRSRDRGHIDRSVVECRDRRPDDL
jgi:hypothetical protein